VNTTELTTALKLHGSFPTSNDLFSSDDFLSLLNHQMLAEIVPMMLKVNEEFFLQYKDFTITNGGLYRIPTRAIGTVIRDLKIVDASNNQTPVVRLFEEDRGSGASGYYLNRNSVELSTDYTSNTLRMKYFARPGKLVATTSCAQITVIAGTTITVSSTPSTMITGTVIDFVQNTNPYDLLDYDIAIATVSGTTLTFAAVPSGLLVGDWICIATEAPVPMVPEEMHPVLIQSALCKTLSSKKDKAYKDELDTLMRVKEDAINMLDPRVQNNSNKVRSGKLLGYFSNRRY
jgi:hypothetical protein